MEFANKMENGILPCRKSITKMRCGPETGKKPTATAISNNNHLVHALVSIMVCKSINWLIIPNTISVPKA